MKKYVIKRYLITAFLLSICCIILSGCKKDEKLPDNDVLIKVTEPVSPTPTPTPTPVPTPIVDRPEGRYDAADQPRSEEDEKPEEISFDDEVMILNPFYADTELAQSIVAKTQAPLFYIDDQGKVCAGVEYPCVAYEYEFIDDASVFGQAGRAAGDDYRVLRVVLKEGINFCNGEQVTIDDVVYSAYVLANKNYDGPIGFVNNDIYGLEDYHSQISSERKEKAEKIKLYGINKDGTYPNVDGIQRSEQKEFWSCWNEAGEVFASDIIKFVNEKYGENAYVQAFLSNQLTWSKVAADESLKTAYAFAIWGYMKSFNARTMIMTDTFDNTYNLNETPLTNKDLFNVIFKYYEYDLDDKTGINYECPVPGKHFEDYVEEIYLSKSPAVEVISGITTGAYRYPDLAMRGCVYFLVGKDVKLEDLNLYVVPRSVYLGNERINDLKGAGEYYLESIDEANNIITLAANDDYMLGTPKKKYIKYIWNE
ncbi:MAG: hypothetical protein K6E85_03565 [Lachnospiraceae bacterium]|nr:hypothetical protein [Lachnospiraceae bacterium]